jgi:Fe-S-cluster containining protein
MSKTNGAGRADPSSLQLPLVELPSTHPCHECGHCCRYLATEIDKPTTFSDYENLHWYLVHRDISVYVDHEGDWFIEFRAVCEHLTPEATCGIYEERPHICEDFSWDECEITTQESAYKYKFDRFPELLTWMEEKRPKAYAKYTKKREAMIRKRREKMARKTESPVELTA